MRNPFRKAKRNYVVIEIRVDNKMFYWAMSDDTTVQDAKNFTQKAFEEGWPLIRLVSRTGDVLILPKTLYTRASIIIREPEK